MSVPSNVPVPSISVPPTVSLPSVFSNPPTTSLELHATGRTDAGHISRDFRGVRTHPDDAPFSTMQSNNSIVDGINQSPLFAAATQAAAPFFTGIRAGHRVFYFAVLPSGDIVVPMVSPQGVRLVPTCRRWLEINLLPNLEVQRRHASPNASERASVLMNCNHNHRGRLCDFQRQDRCTQNPCNFIHVDYRMMASEGAAMTAFNLLARTLPPMAPPPMMMMMMQQQQQQQQQQHLRAMQMTRQPVFIPVTAALVPPTLATAARIIPSAEVPPVQYVNTLPAAMAAPAAVAVRPEPFVIRVRNNNYAFTFAPNGKLVLRFKLRADPVVQTRLVCREWLVNGLLELDDPTRVERTACASTHEHPGSWMTPCLFYLAHNCTRPVGMCGRAHIIAPKVDAPVAVPAAAAAALQAAPTADDFAPILGGSSLSQAAQWVSPSGARAIDFTNTPKSTLAVALRPAVAHVSSDNKSRTHRYTAWCNGSQKCPGPATCMFIHPETARLARMDPSLPERIAFRADLASRLVDFDALYTMVYEALRKDIGMVEEIHQTKKAHRSNFFVFLNEELVGQIKRLEMVDFGRLVSLWRSMIQVVRSEKTLEKLELDVRKNADGTTGLIDFALSAGRDSRAEQHVLALAALTRACFSNKYGDMMCFVARFAAENKAELASFDKDVLKKFSGFCVPKKRDVCLATTWCCHHGGHVSTNGKAGNEQNGSVITLEGLNGNEISDANVPVLNKAKALRAELFEQYNARLVEALRINQDIKDDETKSGFQKVARDATSARDKLATDRANALKEARDCDMEIAKVQDRLTRHADALVKIPLLQRKGNHVELKLREFLGRIRLSNLMHLKGEEDKALAKAATDVRRSLADIKQSEGRLAKSDAAKESESDRHKSIQSDMNTLIGEHPKLEDKLERAQTNISITEEKMREATQKMSNIIAELELLNVVEEDVPPCTTELMFVKKLGKEQEALRVANGFKLTPTTIASLNASIEELIAKRVAAITLAAAIKVEFDDACKHANAEVSAAEVLYAQMLEGRDIVVEARTKAKAARDEADAFRESLPAQLEVLSAEHTETSAKIDSLKADKAATTNAALIAKIDAEGKAAYKHTKTLKASWAALAEQLSDDDSDYNQQLVKLVCEADRLELAASRVLSGEALRERVAANTRAARLRELQQSPDVVEAELTDSSVGVSTVRQSGANGRSRVFVWRHGQQELSIEDRFGALEHTVSKARDARVASVPWLGFMLKQVQQLITEARGTNALCPVAHFGYNPLDTAGCMMQLRKRFDPSWCEASTGPTTFAFDVDEFVPIKADNKPLLEHKELADIKCPLVLRPSTAPITTTTGILQRGATRRLRNQWKQEERDFESSDVLLCKSTTHADNAMAPEAAPPTSAEVDSETWAWSWSASNIWVAEAEELMSARDKKEARIAARMAEEQARFEAKEAKLKAAKQAKAETSKATKVRLQEATVAAIAAPTTEAQAVTFSKADRTAAIVEALEMIRTIKDKDRSYYSFGPSDAAISMVERYTGKTCEIKRKQVELKTTCIGPLPVLACTAISELLLKKTGVRCSAVEKNGTWYVEFDTTATPSSHEQCDRFSAILDVLLEHGCFAAEDTVQDICAKFQAKLYLPADKAPKQRKQTKKDVSDAHVRVRF